MSFQIDPRQKPKTVDLFPAEEREKGYVFKGIYELDGDRLKLYYSRNVAPDATRPERFDPREEDRGMRSFVLKRAPEKEPFIAWGKEVGGLQAGLSIRPVKNVYIHGETITLVVRVRNVGKEAVKFEYVRQFLDEQPPAVTDTEGKAVPQRGVLVEGVSHTPVKVTLGPGKDVELESRIYGASGRRYELVPAGGWGKATTKEWPLLVGTGKVGLRYERVIGNSSSGFLDKLDPALEKLATGQLELEVKADPLQTVVNKPPHVVEKLDMKGRMESGLPWKVGAEPTEEMIRVVTKTFISKMGSYPDYRFREFFEPRYLKKHGLTDKEIAFEVVGGYRGIHNYVVADDNRTILCTLLRTVDGKEVRELFLFRWVFHDGCLYVSPEKAPDPKTGIFTPWILRTKP